METAEPFEAVAAAAAPLETPDAFCFCVLYRFVMDVVDVRLQRNADVLALFGVELEDVQHPRDAHLEEYRGRGRPELHDIPELRAVQVLHRRWTEEMDAALVDPEHDAPGSKPMGSSIRRTGKKMEPPYGSERIIRNRPCRASSLVC